MIETTFGCYNEFALSISSCFEVEYDILQHIKYFLQFTTNLFCGDGSSIMVANLLLDLAQSNEYRFFGVLIISHLKCSK